MWSWQLHIAKRVVFTRFCTLFGVGFRQTLRACCANTTWRVGQHNVEHRETLRAARPKPPCRVPFFSTFHSVQKQQKESRRDGLLSFCQIAPRYNRADFYEGYGANRGFLSFGSSAPLSLFSTEDMETFSIGSLAPLSLFSTENMEDMEIFSIGSSAP